jgi:hypothetical protein
MYSGQATPFSSYISLSEDEELIDVFFVGSSFYGNFSIERLAMGNLNSSSEIETSDTSSLILISYFSIISSSLLSFNYSELFRCPFFTFFYFFFFF